MVKENLFFIEHYFPIVNKIEDILINPGDPASKHAIVQDIILKESKIKFSLPFVIHEFENNEFIDFFVNRAVRYNNLNNKGSYVQNVHRHNYIELIYIYNGSLVQYINNESKTFKKSDICIMDINTLHTECAIGEEDIIIFFGISTQLFEELFLPFIYRRVRNFWWKYIFLVIGSVNSKT